MYEFIHRHLSDLYKTGHFDDTVHNFPKAQLYQMYFAINRLDAEKFSTFDFTLNFGISSEVRKSFIDHLQNGGNYAQIRKELFEPTEMFQLLKLHKYLNWADKKLHSVFFIENKDQIQEDLLADFKDGDGGMTRPGIVDKHGKLQTSVKTVKPQGLQQKEATFVSHNEFLFGR